MHTVDGYEVVQTPQDFQCTVKAPSLLYKHIVGKRGDTRKKPEVETKTSISFLNLDKEKLQPLASTEAV